MDCAAHFGILRRSPARCTGPWSGAENSGLGQPGFHVDHDLAHRVPAFQVAVGVGGGREVEALRVDRCGRSLPASASADGLAQDAPVLGAVHIVQHRDEHEDDVERESLDVHGREVGFVLRDDGDDLPVEPCRLE